MSKYLFAFVSEKNNVLVGKSSDVMETFAFMKTHLSPLIGDFSIMKSIFIKVNSYSTELRTNGIECFIKNKSEMKKRFSSVIIPKGLEKYMFNVCDIKDLETLTAPYNNILPLYKYKETEDLENVINADKTILTKKELTEGEFIENEFERVLLNLKKLKLENRIKSCQGFGLSYKMGMHNIVKTRDKYIIKLSLDLTEKEKKNLTLRTSKHFCKKYPTLSTLKNTITLEQKRSYFYLTLNLLKDIEENRKFNFKLNEIYRHCV